MFVENIHLKYYDFSEPWEKNKTPLVLIHGLGADMDIWFAQIPDFAKFFPVITVDLPGCGKSPELKGEVSIPSICDALYHAISKIVPGKVNLLGISLGGFVALDFSSRYAEKVQQLVLLSAPYTFNNESKPLLYQALESYKKMTMEEIVKTRIGKAFGKIASAEMQEFLIQNILKTKHSVYLKYAAAPIEYDSVEQYKKVKAKTLIVSGELDYIATPAETEKINQAIVNSEKVILKDTGHALSMENPKELNPRVIEFLKNSA